MPERFLSDIADIMAGRAIDDEMAPSMDELVPGWRRRPDEDLHGVEIWQSPGGQLVGVASQALKARLRAPGAFSAGARSRTSASTACSSPSQGALVSAKWGRA